MAEGGLTEEPSCSTMFESKDGDLGRSVVMGSQGCYEFFCQPCDIDENHVEAEFYCKNCDEYMCNGCRVFHKKFKQMRRHDIADVRHMIHKPPVSSMPGLLPVTMATHVRDIKVKGSIRSSALISTKHLLVSDQDSNLVRLIDTGSGRQLSELKLIDRPWQVTRISYTNAAVTIPNKRKIVLFRTQPQLSVVRVISVQGKCCGIAYMDNTFIVAFSEGHIDIISMSGVVHHTISTDQSGSKIFAQPQFVTVNTNTHTMYVSNWVGTLTGGDVKKLSLEGNVLAEYSFYGNKYGLPHQLALDSLGMVYVPWDEVFSRSVKQLSADCVLSQEILPNLSGRGRALSFDEDTQQLYVGQSNGFVKIYKLF